jgi:hypothetical protein
VLNHVQPAVEVLVLIPLFETLHSIRLRNPMRKGGHDFAILLRTRVNPDQFNTLFTLPGKIYTRVACI